MTYYKQLEDGYIVAIGAAEQSFFTEISQEEYTQLSALIAAKPDAPADKCYRLSAAATWELCDLPTSAEPEQFTQSELENMTNADLEMILHRYGISASMSKTNMVRLILAAQGGDAYA